MSSTETKLEEQGDSQGPRGAGSVLQPQGTSRLGCRDTHTFTHLNTPNSYSDTLTHTYTHISHSHNRIHTGCHKSSPASSLTQMLIHSHTLAQLHTQEPCTHTLTSAERAILISTVAHPTLIPPSCVRIFSDIHPGPSTEPGPPAPCKPQPPAPYSPCPHPPTKGKETSQKHLPLSPCSCHSTTHIRVFVLPATPALSPVSDSLSGIWDPGFRQALGDLGQAVGA